MLTEFVYNNSSHVSIRILLFFINKDYSSSITVYSEQDIAFKWAQDLVINLNTLYQKLRQNISVVLLHYQDSEDAYLLSPELSE